MSETPRDFYYLNPFHDDHQQGLRAPAMAATAPSSAYNPLWFDPSLLSFGDCLQGSMDYNTTVKAFGLSPSSSEVNSAIDGNQNPMRRGDHLGNKNGEISVTPTSPISSPSIEAGGEEDSGKGEKEKTMKGLDDGEESSKRLSKAKKKGEKKQREPRFAFMTKSDVDHLEDGYRWRKYGQKAVKNSPYPRSYYRCTTQKCTVKKRVERSYQDPTIVVTTYEGQHSHPVPSTLRGHATAMFSPSLPHDLFLQTNGTQGRLNAPSLYPRQYQFPDYGLLQDMVPSPFLKREH